VYLNRAEARLSARVTNAIKSIWLNDNKNHQDTVCFSSLSARSRVVREKLIVAQLVKKNTVFHGTRRFVTVFSKAQRWFIS
jgi:hypothetical protein